MHIKHTPVSREFTCIKDEIFGDEKWKPLEGFDLADEYLVSNFGRVYNNTKKFYVGLQSSVANKSNQSYKIAYLNTKNGFKGFGVHRLVALAFVKNDDPTRKLFVNHINGNPECNLYINLEWCTPIENVHHAVNTNLIRNKLYSDDRVEPLWKLKIYYAWVYNLPNMTNEKAYKFYNKYTEKYDDNLPKLTYNEFLESYDEFSLNDKDFQSLFDFYKNGYF